MIYRIQGKVTIEGGEPEMPLYVRATVEPPNASPVQTDLRLEGTDTFAVELQAPSSVSSTAPPTSAKVEIVGYDANTNQPVSAAPKPIPLESKRWHPSGGDLEYDLATDVSWEEVNQWGPNVLMEASAGRRAKYRVRGTVVTEINGRKQPVSDLDVKVIEYDPRRNRRRADVPAPSPPSILPPPLLPMPPSIDPSLLNPPAQPARRDLLGTVRTASDGSFDFTFEWSVLPLIGGSLPDPPDRAPDVIVQLCDELGGKTVVLLETRPRMSIETDENLGELAVPADLLLKYPRPKIQTGGIFQSIGYLPVDSPQSANPRIDSEGYATSHSGDWVQCTNAPFGGTLDLFARFQDSRVTHYKVSYGRWQGGQPPQQLADVDQGFYNFYRENGSWKTKSLGPQALGSPQVGNLYESIDGGDPSKWLFDELKMRWNTRGLDNGKYRLRIEGYRHDPSAGKVEPVPNSHQEIDLRLDNSRPEVEILGIHRQKSVITPGEELWEDVPESECAIVKLASKTEQLGIRVHVHHPEGHLAAWGLGAGYGRNRTAPPEFHHADDHGNHGHAVQWAGMATPRTLPLAGKVGIAWPESCGYTFGLWAAGRSIDGRGRLREQVVTARQTVYVEVP